MTSDYENNLYVDDINITGTVGVEEINRNNRLIVYPNPATNQLAVSSRQWAIKEIEIYDVLGQKIYVEQLTTDNYQLTVDVSRWNAGIYFLKVRGEKLEIGNWKLVVNH